MLKYLSFFIIFSCSAQALVYQQCKWNDQPLTDRAIKLNQEFLDADNISHSDLRNSCYRTIYNQYSPLNMVTNLVDANHFFSAGVIPSSCFLASMAKRAANTPPSEQSHEQYYHCNSIHDSNDTATMAVRNPNTNKLHHMYLRNPCISEDYLSSHVKTFNKMAYCFDLSPKEIHQLFAIIHHESQFTLNAKSPTEARCAGQLIKANIFTSNIDIIQNSSPVSDIYQRASAQCPSLIDRTIPSDILCVKNDPCPHKHLQKGGYNAKMAKLQKYPVTCKVTTNLSQCFFYAFLYFKKILKEFDNNFTRHNEFDQTQTSKEFFDKYGTGVTPNEVIVAVPKEDASSKPNYLFTTATQAYTEVQKHGHPAQSSNPMYDMDVQTVPLISDMEHFKWFTTQLSYNGGDSIARIQVKNFLTFFKDQVAQADCSGRRLAYKMLISSSNKYCGYKKRLMSGQSLDMDAVKQEFTSYLRVAVNEEGQRMYTRDEIYEYPGKINANTNHFQNSDGLSRLYLERLAKKHDIKLKTLSKDKQQQVQEAVNTIKDQCHIELP